MEHCCSAVVGTVEWVNKSRTEDVVEIDVGQLRVGGGGGGGCGGKCVGCDNIHFLLLHCIYSSHCLFLPMGGEALITCECGRQADIVKR